MGRAVYGPEFRSGYGYGLDYGFDMMGVGRSGSYKCEPVTSLVQRAAVH